MERLWEMPGRAPIAVPRPPAAPRLLAARWPAAARAALSALRAALLAALLLGWASAWAEAPDKFAGTYRIEGWRDTEERGLFHFFYLQPDGRFLLAAEWAGNERSQFVGEWSVADDRLYLNGKGRVETNQGTWRTEFSRTYRVQVEATGFLLQPEPKKNRYGLLGWPQAYRFYRRQPAPNLPGRALPQDAAALAKLIAEALAAKR